MLEQQLDTLLALQFGVDSDDIDKIGIEFRRKEIHPLIQTYNSIAVAVREGDPTADRQEVVRLREKVLEKLLEANIPYDEDLVMTAEAMMTD